MGDKKRWRQHYPLVDEVKDPEELMIIAQVEKVAAAIYAECPSLHSMVSNGERGVLTYGVLNMIHRAMPDTFPIVGNDDIPTREVLAARTILFGQEIDVAEVIAPPVHGNAAGRCRGGRPPLHLQVCSHNHKGVALMETPLGAARRITASTDRIVDDAVADKASAIYHRCPTLHLMVSNGEGNVCSYGVLEMISHATPDTFPREGNETIPTGEYLAAREVLFGETFQGSTVVLDMETLITASKRIVNLTKHQATAPQVADGVEDLPEDFRKCLLDILNFEKCPDNAELRYRALRVKGLLADHLRSAEAVRGAAVMIGGMPAFDTVLEAVLKESGAHVGYSFTKRQCTETSLDDGGVALLYIFKHEGFIWVS